ncbi:cytidylyltransferase domain-containing protein [Pseudomonadota bacterium]
MENRELSEVQKPIIAAIVPMRHHSERIPGKNYRLLNGLPLYHYIIDSLLACNGVDKILIDTDSPVIMKDAQEHFPGVLLYDRPPHLRNDHLSMNIVLENSIQQMPADYYIQTHSTNPLLRPETIDAAISKFFESDQDYDSLFSVTRIQTRLWDSAAMPVNHDPDVLLRTQDLPPLFEENSCLYLFAGSEFRVSGNRIGKRPCLYEIDPLESIDIDEESDFRLAEFQMKEREK